jgi:gliding motility-associated-like protein
MKSPKAQHSIPIRKFILNAFLSLSMLIGVSPLLAQDDNNRSLPNIHMPNVMQFCPATSVVITPDSITDGLAPYSFEWASNGIILSIDSTLNLNLEDTALFQLTVRDSEGKIARDTIELVPHEPIDAGFQVNKWEGCSPVEIIFTSDYLSFQHVSSMTWEFGNGHSQSQLASMVYTYEQEGNFEPALHITDEYGCIWHDTLDIGIRVFPTPRASFEANDLRLYLPETSLLLENTSSGADQFIWQYTGASGISEFEPRIEFPQNIEKTYKLELTAYNAFGCSDQTSKNIEVVQAIELYLPNAFTPDGDGINDTWQIKGLGIDAFHLSIEIYDLWGTIVFQSDSRDAQWDAGFYTRGNRVPSGQYNYRVLARDTERGIGHLFEGHIFVLY